MNPESRFDIRNLTFVIATQMKIYDEVYLETQHEFSFFCNSIVEKRF